VDKSFKQIAATTKEALQTQKALQSLAESQGSELPQIISNLDPNGSKPSAGSSVPMPDAKDITAEFLAPTQQSEDYTDSSIVVYKGILRRLGGMRPRANTIAVLAGSDKHAVSVVVSEDLATVVKSKHVLDLSMNRWGWQSLGLSLTPANMQIPYLVCQHPKRLCC
jgi:hypothetical protein